MDRRFKLGDSVHVIKSGRSIVVDVIDSSFGVAVFSVRYDDCPEPCQWFAPPPSLSRTRYNRPPRSSPGRMFVHGWLLG